MLTKIYQRRDVIKDKNNVIPVANDQMSRISQLNLSTFSKGGTLSLENLRVSYKITQKYGCYWVRKTGGRYILLLKTGGCYQSVWMLPKLNRIEDS